jgi:hypothetical protein
MIPSTVMSIVSREPAGGPPQISELLRLLLAIALGFVAGPLLAFFQWRRLRSHVPRAWLWLPANAVAWAGGMPMVFYAAHVAAGQARSMSMVVMIAASLVLTGALVGAIHGAFLVWLILRSGKRPDGSIERTASGTRDAAHVER